VLVDYGAPGWLPAELSPAGFLGAWSEATGDSIASLASVPRLSVNGADDPDWVRTMVWYYYRLGSYYRSRGALAAAVRAWDEGLKWAPGEQALIEARSEFAFSESISSPPGVEHVSQPR
jgi:hypothetical protein